MKRVSEKRDQWYQEDHIGVPAVLPWTWKRVHAEAAWKRPGFLGGPSEALIGYISKTTSSLSQTNRTVNLVFWTVSEYTLLGSWWHSFWWHVVLDTNSYIIWGWQPMLFLLRKPNALLPPPLLKNELVLFLKKVYYLSFLFLFWLHGVQDLSSWPGTEPTAPALEAWCLNHWTPGEVLN